MRIVGWGVEGHSAISITAREEPVVTRFKMMDEIAPTMPLGLVCLPESVGVQVSCQWGLWNGRRGAERRAPYTEDSVIALGEGEPM